MSPDFRAGCMVSVWRVFGSSVPCSFLKTKPRWCLPFSLSRGPAPHDPEQAKQFRKWQILFITYSILFIFLWSAFIFTVMMSNHYATTRCKGENVWAPFCIAMSVPQWWIHYCILNGSQGPCGFVGDMVMCSYRQTTSPVVFFTLSVHLFSRAHFLISSFSMTGKVKPGLDVMQSQGT